MTVTLYATKTDVRNAFEGDIPVNTKNDSRLDALITRASAKLLQLAPSLNRRMSAGEITPEVPMGMVVEAVLRVWRNPAGYTQQGVGPFQGSFSARAATNEIVFDENEIKELLGDEITPGSFSVDYPGRSVPLEPSIDAEPVYNVALHFAGP